MNVVEILHFHMFHGCGSGAAGMNDAEAAINGLQAKFRCLGGMDIDPAGTRDFERFTGVRGTVRDLMDREQYVAYHGAQPPTDWREATPQDVQNAAGGERPHIVFLSAPCKGFSGLLSEAKSKTDRYQALNRLTLRGVWLMLEAWANDPPELIIFENVPRLATRGRSLLDRITAMLRAYGYATAETVHDCGELAGLAQSRKRFLLVARHIAKVPPLLYEPPRRPLRAVGDVLGKLPLPGVGNPMHRVPALQWKTWVRLAFVEAGSDWRSLNKLAVVDGHLRDYLIVPTMRNGAYGVRRWEDTSNEYRIVPWDSNAMAVTSAHGTGQSVADPRPGWDRYGNNLRVVDFGETSPTVVAGGKGVQGGWMSVADPRVGMDPQREAYRTGGHYGVMPWDAHSGAVSAAACHDNGRWSVADSRTCTETQTALIALPSGDTKMIARIVARDGTWHRPFTTLELAAIQSIFDPEDPLQAEAFFMDGVSDSAHRERIGNAVPRKAAKAIASEMGRTLLLAWSGETFSLSSAPVWVRPYVAALMLSGGGEAT